MPENGDGTQKRRRRARKRQNKGFLYTLESAFEWLLFQSRWLVAPIYLGLVSALLMLLYVFGEMILGSIKSLLPGSHRLDIATQRDHSEERLHQVVLDALSFIDIALVANLVLIVIFAGYYHFVSKIELEDDEDWPPWMVEVDFADLKLKLFASIIALTGIELLKAFMALRTDQPLDSERLWWLVAVHVTFLFTALLSAIADRVTSGLGRRSS